MKSLQNAVGEREPDALEKSPVTDADGVLQEKNNKPVASQL